MSSLIVISVQKQVETINAFSFLEYDNSMDTSDETKSNKEFKVIMDIEAVSEYCCLRIYVI